MNDHEYPGIDYHMEDGERHAAINVKVYGHIDIEPNEAFAQQAWDNTVINFWAQATALAHEAGYSDVFSEGRSDGWLVPFRQIGMAQSEREKRNLKAVHTGVPQFYSWPGQGGSLGYPRYPDIDDVGERSRFRAFAKRIGEMMQGVPQMIQDEAKVLAEEAVASLSQPTRERDKQMASKYTRRHYEDMAEILKGAYQVHHTSKWPTIEYIQEQLETLFAEDNLHFDLERFKKAVEEGA